MPKEEFAGHQKHEISLLVPLEQKVLARCLDKIPLWLETYHLTLLTIVWSGLVVVFGFLARNNIQWVWGISLVVILQYISDLFDGALGRHRNTGLVRWGFYMDHFLDYIFLCSLVIGYSFLLHERSNILVLTILAVLSAFMVHSFLMFGALNKFSISYKGIGATELRIVFLILNMFLIFFGKTYLEKALPYILIVSIICLIIIVYKRQKEIWKYDMDIKKRNK